MVKLILKPPHALQVITPAGERLEPRADGSYDVTAHPALITQHPDWEFTRVEETDAPAAAPEPKPQILLKAPSPAVCQIFAGNGDSVRCDEAGLFDVTEFPEIARQYASWRIPAETAE